MKKWLTNVKAIGYRCAVSCFWLLFRYNSFKKYCSKTLKIDSVYPFKWYNWHHDVQCFSAKLNGSGKQIFIKTDGNLHLSANEYRMTELFYSQNPESCQHIELYDCKGPKEFIVFEYVAGQTLEEVFNKDCEINWARFFSKLIIILDTLNQLNMIHRDITPSNLIIQSDRETGILELILIDFAFTVLKSDQVCIDSQLRKSDVVYLGQSYALQPYLWDDAYSSLQILIMIEEKTGHSFSNWREQIQKRVGSLTHSFVSSIIL